LRYQRAKCYKEKLSMGQTVNRANSKWAKLTVAQTIHLLDPQLISCWPTYWNFLRWASHFPHSLVAKCLDTQSLTSSEFICNEIQNACALKGQPFEELSFSHRNWPASCLWIINLRAIFFGLSGWGCYEKSFAPEFMSFILSFIQSSREIHS